jgi:hypothetical protein
MKVAPPKNEGSRCAGTHARASRNNFCAYTTSQEPFSPAPLTPSSDAPPVPEDFWFVHRHRKGGAK